MAGWMRRRHRCRRAQAALLAGALVAGALAAFSGHASADPSPLTASITSTNGEGRRESPGRSCDEGGVGAYWHYDWSADIGPGPLGNPPVEALTHLQVSSDTQRYPNLEGAYAAGDPTAYLQGGESFAALLTDRGSVKLELRSGDCDDPSLAFDGSQASGAGTWELVGATGAYRDAVGTGTFALGGAELNPGADNVLDLDIDGNIDVPAPELDVAIVKTFWGGLGTDYLTRRVSVIFRVTNVGDGDSYGARVTDIDSPNTYVTRIGSKTVELGDVAVGESRTFLRRFQLGLLGPCSLIILDCPFSVDVTADLPDALDRSHVDTVSRGTRAPNLPPPL